MRDIIIVKDCKYSPITLSGIVKSGGTTAPTTFLPVVFRMVLPYDKDSGRDLELVIDCGKYVSVKFILGIPFLKNSKAPLCFETNMLCVPVLHFLNIEPSNGFPLLFQHPIRCTPQTQSTRDASRNISVNKDIIDIMITLDTKSTYLLM